MRYSVTVLVMGLLSLAFVGAACNADNCLGPFRAMPPPRAPVVVLTPRQLQQRLRGVRPAYLRPCGPSRISSAYPCLASISTCSTTTADSACYTGQVAVNPSFYGLPPLYPANSTPWTITHNGGSAGYVFDLYSYTEADHDEYYGDERSM